MTGKKQPILSLKDVIVKFNPRGIVQTSLNDISLDIFDGETIAFVGQSTSGKSILCKMLLNRFNYEVYVSNGSVMYYPSQKLGVNHTKRIDHNVDLINYHKATLSGVTKRIIYFTQMRIYEKANILICDYRSKVAQLQYQEAVRQTKRLFGIYKKAEYMASYDKTELIAKDYAENKTYSINGQTSPAVPLIVELIEGMKQQEAIIAEAYLALSSASPRYQKKEWEKIKNAKAKIKVYKKFVSNIQLEIARKNYLFLKKIKKEIKFLEKKETTWANEISFESMKRMYQYNRTLGMENHPEILVLLEKIRAQEQILASVVHEASNFTNLELSAITQYKKIMHAIDENQHNLLGIDWKIIDETLKYIDAQRFLTEFEQSLKNLLFALQTNKPIDRLEILYLLTDWEFKSRSMGHNKHQAKSEEHLLFGNTIAAVYADHKMNLKQNVNIGAQIESAFLSHEHISKTRAKDKTLEIMYRVGISDAEDVYYQTPFKSSRAINQLASIALALAYEPKILILDEPTFGLGATIQYALLDLIKEFQRELKFTILFFSNDLGVIGKMSDRIVVMNSGEILEYGSKEDIMHHPLHPITNNLINNFNNLDVKPNIDKSKNFFAVLSHNKNQALKKNYTFEQDKINKIPLNAFSKSHFARVDKPRRSFNSSAWKGDN